MVDVKCQALDASMQTDPEDFTFKNIMVDEISSNADDEIFGQDDPFKLADNLN